MDLIERYLQAIGHHLPAHQRDDILSELRSSIYDELEDSAETGSDKAGALAIIKRMGPPQEVANSYHPSKQYLVGPALYPFFKLALGIVFTAVVGTRLLMVALSLFSDSEPLVIRGELWGILESLPFLLGLVVAVFWVLQQADTQINRNETFDPRVLPPLHRDSDRVSRGEKSFNILVNAIVLVILARIVQEGGLAWNPVLERFFPWIGVSMLIGIGLGMVLLWQGYWRLSTRVAVVLSNLFAFVLLLLLVQGHSAWLSTANLPGFLGGWIVHPQLLQEDQQLAGMVALRFGLAIAALISGIETLVSIYRLLRARTHSAHPVGTSLAGLVASNQ